MKLKNLSRLTALLLAFILSFSVVAEATSLEDLTAEQLNTWYMAAAKNGEFATKEVIGVPVEFECKEGEDKSGYTFQWYQLIGDDQQKSVPSDEGRPSFLTVVTTAEQQSFYCVATDKQTNSQEYSKVFILAPYTSENADKYADELYTIWYYDVIENSPEDSEDLDMSKIIAYRYKAYRLMTDTWNVTLSGDTQNLAKAIMEYYAQNQDDYLLCTCGINSDGTVSDEILHDPYGVHEKDCPWYDGSIIVPSSPAQPPLYKGEPNGKQYISNKEYTLPMTKAIILPEGGSATVRVSGSAVSAQARGVTSSTQWQVYNGSEWANILGETSDTLVVTTAKLQTIFNLTGVAHLRYYDKANSIVLASVDVTSQAIAGGEYPEETTQTISVETREDSTTETPATYNVVVNYLFENNEIVADPYTANLAKGSNFSATVIFPTVQGYLPYLNDVQENSLKLDITNINADVIYNVVYKPTNVKYTVIHYQQNLNDDKYAEAERETKQGLTNSTVKEVAKKYDGFYALLYEKPEIAADGSTKVEIYYDRYYYLMNFDLDGGYGVEPIYARYGAPISGVGTPTKAGYTFKGWSLDGTNTVALPEKMPAENLTYKAIWKADDTVKVTVVFWGENADDEEYSYIKSAEVNVKPGTEFTYSEDGTLICALEVHTHDASCGYACNQQEHVHDEACYKLTCTQEVHTHSESCYTCGIENHTHDTRCYAGVGSSSSAGTGAPSNPSNGYVAREAWSWDGKVIYINGTWYKYTGNTATGNIAPTTCGKTEGTHTHTDDCLGCGKTEHTHTDYTGSCYTLTCTEPAHTHSDACGYKCGKTAHTHNDDCYMNGAGLDSNLWKFVRSETVTVAADGSSVVNVYYDRTEKTLTFKYNYRDRNYQSTETITAKWGADISEQYKKIAKNAGSTFWSAKTSGDGPYTNYFGVMPQSSATYYNRGNTGDDGTMTYWGQDLNGEYTVKLFEVTGVGGYTVTDEDRYEFEGFTYHHGTKNGEDCGGAAFYYTRNSYTLTFNDGYNDVKSESVKYEAPLRTYSSYVPAVPSAYEPGSVRFGGWYLNPECSGAEYKLDENNMPADNVLLYAKWVPVSHKVEFYLDADALEAGNKLSTHPDITVPHGSKADPTPANPTNGSYTFVGWFYMDGDVEKAFDFANMPVNKNLQVYGKWSSNVLKTYTVHYKIKDTDTKVADPTTGSGLAGVTKTFYAKGGAELNAGYQEGYFPVVKSHSMTIDINATEENNTNVFTFWYVEKQAVPYTVKYLNKETGEPVADEKTVSDNRKAVVTETFVPVSGMMPDAYQKRLVVSAEEGAVNEIIFYYTKDTTHAYYKITHYTENLGTDAQGNPTWTEYASSQAVGDIGTTYTADPMTIPGFTYDSNVAGTVVSGELTANGLELKLYYTRNSYPYQVRYLEQGSGTQLHVPTNGTGKYGQVIPESAIDIANYTAVEPTSQTLNIRIEESSEAKLNIITFYYTENEATINYVAVGPDGCGTVSPTSETLKVLTGTAQGSTPTANENFKFVGWYTDEACTKPVDAGWVGANNKITPVKDTSAAWGKQTTYYAKFEYNLTTLTITKTGLIQQTSEDCESAIITVTDSSGNLVARFALQNNSVTIDGLTVGKVYTITEENSWTWRYKNQAQQTHTITPPNSEGISTNSITISNEQNNPYWLGGDNYKVNTFGTGTTTNGGEQE